MLIKTSFRHLWKNKTFSFLNITGLSVGIACAALILLWAEDEITFNAFHEKEDRIFQILENQPFEGKTYTFSATPGLLASALVAEIPEVTRSARFSWGDRYAFSFGDKSTFEEGYLVDSSFLEILSFPLIEGNPKTALNGTNAIVISQTMSKKFFGEESPMGKTLRVNNKDDFLVTGVLKDVPPNSSLRFEWLASFHIFEKKNSWWTNWNTNGVQTIVLLNSASDATGVNQKLNGFIQRKEKETVAQPFLFAMKDWHLRSEFKEGIHTGKGRIEYVRLFSIIAGFILLIACFNYMNLSTARSEQRSKEVGIRKVVGAGRSSLAWQFITESILTSFAATMLAILLLYLALPYFNALVDKHLALRLTNPLHSMGLLSIVFISGFLAGSYPSFYLSAYRPLAILKSMVSRTKGGIFSVRRGLVIAQFCVSAFLIFCTIVIYQQVSHVKQRHLGYNKEHLIYVGTTPQINAKLPVIEQELLETGFVQNVARSDSRVLDVGSSSGGFTWSGKDPSRDKLISMNWVTPGFVSTLGMQIKEGRDFYKEAAMDSNSVLINETFAKLIKADSRKEDIIGETIHGDPEEYRIVGVIEDFRFGSMYEETEPLIVFSSAPVDGVVFIRMDPVQDLPSALSSVEDVLLRHNPGFPFEYKFLDEEFDKLFRSETTVGRLAFGFSALSVLICCLGLFGLAAFAAERRTREIGIRKVLGATTAGIVGLLSKEFLILVLISLLIASPFAWWAAHAWLQKFEYHIAIPWWVFLCVYFIALSVAFLTISFQSIKAALSNPVRSLRME